MKNFIKKVLLLTCALSLVTSLNLLNTFASEDNAKSDVAENEIYVNGVLIARTLVSDYNDENFKIEVTEDGVYVNGFLIAKITVDGILVPETFNDLKITLFSTTTTVSCSYCTGKVSRSTYTKDIPLEDIVHSKTGSFWHWDVAGSLGTYQIDRCNTCSYKSDTLLSLTPYLRCPGI